jgi:hypothetical protein
MDRQANTYFWVSGTSDSAKPTSSIGASILKQTAESRVTVQKGSVHGSQVIDSWLDRGARASRAGRRDICGEGGDLRDALASKSPPVAYSMRQFV